MGTSVKHPSRSVKVSTPKHGLARSLRQLDGSGRRAYDGTTMDAPEQANDWAATAETLVALGAPLSGWRPNRRLAPEVALTFALRFASTDASLLRSLPVVLARTWRELDWSKLENSARAQDSLALLGMVTELTASLAGFKELGEKARRWWRPPRETRHLFRPRNDFDRELAEHRTPPVARKWGFLMNMGEDSFRALYERHAGQV
jgi:hypothetical protein